MKHEHGHDAPPFREGLTHHAFDDPTEIAQRLEAPEREAWQKPEEVITSLELSPDATVADIGAGTGYFVVRLARRLPKGTVIGLDTEPQMVAYLRQRAAELELTNVVARLVKPADTSLLDEQVDLLLCVDTYHHMPERVASFANYAHYLKPGGKLVIIDRPASAPEGPPPEVRVSAETVAKELASAGFTLTKVMDFLQPFQYGLVFSPTDATPVPA